MSAEPSEVLVVDDIVQALCRAGVDTFFLLTGGAIAPFVDAVARFSGAKYYCVQHEQAASMAVDGYYRATGKPACVVVTSGPGVQNVLNGLCGCFYDSVPALFISGQVNMRESLDSIRAKPRQVGFQEMPVVDCFRPFTKYIQKVTTTDELAPALTEAVRMMMHGRKGPSLVDIPVNVQMSSVQCPPLVLPSCSTSADENGNNPSPSSSSSSKKEEEIGRVVEMLRQAERPLFVLGDGARGAKSELASLLQQLQLPYTTSWGGLDVLPTIPVLSLGPHGVYGDRIANFALQNADLLVVLGARLDTRQTGGNLKAFSTRSRKVIVDVDANEFEKLGERGAPIDLGLAMDARDFVAQLHSALAPIEQPLAIAEWRDKLKQWREKYGEEQRPTFDGFVSPYELLAKLDGLLPSDAIVAVDTGATLVWTFQTLRTRHSEQRVFSNLGNSSMGYALPAAIGAAIGAPERPVYCIIGDGGFQQNIQELATAAHYKLNIKVFVLNNSGYGIIKQFQNSYLGGRHVATTSEDLYGKAGPGIDFVAITRAYGVDAQRITATEQLQPELVTSPGLAVYDVNINEQQGIQPKTDFGNSLENMSPLLESAADMIVPPPPQLRVSGWVKM